MSGPGTVIVPAALPWVDEAQLAQTLWNQLAVHPTDPTMRTIATDLEHHLRQVAEARAGYRGPDVLWSFERVSLYNFTAAALERVEALSRTPSQATLLNELVDLLRLFSLMLSFVSALYIMAASRRVRRDPTGPGGPVVEDLGRPLHQAGLGPYSVGLGRAWAICLAGSGPRPSLSSRLAFTAVQWVWQEADQLAMAPEERAAIAAAKACPHCGQGLGPD